MSLETLLPRDTRASAGISLSPWTRDVGQMVASPGDLYALLENPVTRLREFDGLSQLGDRHWRDLLDSHDDLSSRLIGKHRGNLVKCTGDGVLATFDGPGRAVRCALALREETKSIGLQVRAGLHCGEVEIRGNDIGGIAVHAAARVMAQSLGNEVLVSRVVTDLVAGTDLKFSERGSYDLKGLPGKWDLFAADR